MQQQLLDKLKLTVITSSPSSWRGHEDVARAALEAGVRALQLRDKTASDREFLRLALSLRRLCFEYDALFLVNDRVDVAMLAGSDGVHLGVDDIPVAEARSLLPRGAIIGFSPASVPEAVESQAHGADYLGVGPVFPTLSKDDAMEPVGLEVLTGLQHVVDLPIIALGGINIENIRSVYRTGVAGVAVISAIARAGSMESAARDLLAASGEEN